MQQCQFKFKRVETLKDNIFPGLDRQTYIFIPSIESQTYNGTLLLLLFLLAAALMIVNLRRAIRKINLPIFPFLYPPLYIYTYLYIEQHYRRKRHIVPFSYINIELERYTFARYNITL